MRSIVGSVLVATFALALPAVGGLPSSAARDVGTHVLDVVRAERIAVEEAIGRPARAAGRLLDRGERALTKFVRSYETRPSFDTKKMRLAAKAGLALERAAATGALADAEALGNELNGFIGILTDQVGGVVADVTMERDRILNDTYRTKVDLRLEKGVALLDVAKDGPDGSQRAKGLAKALPVIEAALASAQKFCTRETRPNCPRGAIAQNTRLGYRGGGGLTVYDIRWDVDLHMATGVYYATRRGVLSTSGQSLSAPLPWTLRRGESLDVLDHAVIESGYRIDGTVTWVTSVGELVVPIHVD